MEQEATIESLVIDRGGHAKGVNCIRIYTGAKANHANCRDKFALMLAVEHDDVREVEHLVTAGADVNIQCLNGNTALMLAASQGRVECLQLLLRAGAKRHLINKAGRTALMYAAVRSEKRCLSKLLQENVNVNVADNDGRTALMFAASHGCEESVNVLINHGAMINATDNFGRTAFILALLKGQKKCAMTLIRKSVCVNQTSNDGMTALMAAARWSLSSCIKLLLKRGAEIDKADSEGRTALFIAAEYQQAKTLETLVQAGSDVNWRDHEGRTPLMYLFERTVGKDVTRLKMCVKILVNAGADVNARNKNGKTVLMFAIGHTWNSKSIYYLIATGADANVPDKEGRTALMLAAAIPVNVEKKRWLYFEDFDNFDLIDNIHEKDSVTTPLIAHINDINTQDTTGHTALMIACASRFYWCVKRLILAGADVNIRDFAGRTALMYSVMSENFLEGEKWRDKRIPNCLIKYGVDVNAQDEDGVSALMFAARSGYSQIIVSLVSAGGDIHQTDRKHRTALVHGIKRFNMESVTYLLHLSGNSLELSAEFHPLVEKIGSCFQNYDMSIIQFLLINGTISFRVRNSFDFSEYVGIRTLSKLSPYTSAGIVYRYLLANCCIFDKDMQRMRRGQLVGAEDHEEETKELILEAVSNPWPLVKLAFIAVSLVIGPHCGREQRVRQTGLPKCIQECLLFQRPIVRLPQHHWKDIPLIFNPVEYERLPAPYPLLYNWPFGRELVTCECTDCNGQGQSFALKGHKKNQTLKN